MAKRITLLYVTVASHMGFAPVLAALLQIQLSANSLEKEQKMMKCLGPYYLKYLGEASGSWFWHSQVLVIAAIWEVKLWMKGLSFSFVIYVYAHAYVCVSPSPSVNLSKYINKP